MPAPAAARLRQALAGKRCFFALLVLTLLLRTVRGGEPWFASSLVGIEAGPTGAQFGYSATNDTRYCSAFDGREIVRRAAEAHAQYVVMWARDGDFAYYDSRFLPKAPGLGARDPLRQAALEARARRIPLIAYCVVQQAGHFLEEHPEWAMRGADGKPIKRFCLNSGYLEAMKQIAAEQLAYGIDGFHIDMLDQGFGPPYGCWCPSCQRLFQEEFGKPMPKAVTWDKDWEKMLEFRYRSSERFEEALRSHIQALNPRVSVDFNYHGNPPFSWETGQRPAQHATCGDFVTGETGMWGFSALTVGLNAEFYRAAAPGRPFQVAISRDARMYHNQTVRPVPDLQWELFTLLAHAAFVTVVDKTAFDGSLDPLAYERFETVFHDARQRAAHFGQEPVREVGIYFSSRTRDWFARNRPEDYFQSFLGAHKGLVYEHIPWGVILDENVTLETLRNFPVVLLPNAAIISEHELGLFQEYVAEGGNLIVTGISGCFDRYGLWQSSSTLEPLVGGKVRRRLETLDNWVRFAGSSPRGEKSLALSDHPGRPVLVPGAAVVLEPGAAEPLGELLEPFRTVRQQEKRETTDWPMSPSGVAGPAALLHHLGKGAVLTFAASPDSAIASEHYVPELRQLLRNAVRTLHPNPRIEIQAPSTVEAVVTDDPRQRQLRIHLIAYNPPARTMPPKRRPYVLPALIEDIPSFRATISLRDKIKSARAFNPSTELKRKAKAVSIKAETIHEIIVLNY